jgi:hypothetical protein
MPLDNHPIYTRAIEPPDDDDDMDDADRDNRQPSISILAIATLAALAWIGIWLAACAVFG